MKINNTGLNLQNLKSFEESNETEHSKLISLYGQQIILYTVCVVHVHNNGRVSTASILVQLPVNIPKAQETGPICN